MSGETTLTYFVMLLSCLKPKSCAKFMFCCIIRIEENILYIDSIQVSERHRYTLNFQLQNGIDHHENMPI